MKIKYLKSKRHRLRIVIKKNINEYRDLGFMLLSRAKQLYPENEIIKMVDYDVYTYVEIKE